MFTIVASSTTISWAVPSRARTAQRFGSCLSAVTVAFRSIRVEAPEGPVRLMISGFTGDGEA